MNYLEDEDQEQPVMPGRNPDDLEAYLRQKMAGPTADQTGRIDAQYASADRAHDRSDQANLAASLLQASGKIGSFGGRATQVDTQPIQAMGQQAQQRAQGLEKGAQGAEQGQDAERKQAIVSYLTMKRQDKNAATSFDQKKQLLSEKAKADKLAKDEDRTWREGESQKNRDGADARQQNAIAAASAKTLEREKTLAARGSSEANKKKEVDYQTRINNIDSNVDRLSTLINDYGTVETFGPQESMMDQAIQDIAVDYAKLVDPDSVARESEVESAKKMLKVKGMGVANSTAIDSLANFKEQMLVRVNSRRQAQGLEPIPLPGAATDGATAIASQPTAPKKSLDEMTPEEMQAELDDIERRLGAK